ncbi:hypothetical protein JCM12296A_52600 [Desulfosarcina cetonica]|uniref:methyl-accepting chemotaxis protein n=1 Tax=Desulfosarcina cetonica TaxID=90730 RepID=UPI0006CFD13E|nr:methyl-accepting chemotaxis protein [Desulfosarcina cetonica]
MKNTLHKIGPRILLPAAIATVVFSVALFIIAETTITRMVDRNLQRIARLKVADIANSEKRVADRMLSLAALFCRAKPVLTAYHTAYQGNLGDPADPQMEAARRQLRDYVASVDQGYREMHGGQALRIHFHVPPARSLLRIWKKKQNKSDDLIAFRNTVATISKGSHTPITGIEIGRGGFVIRGIAPVVDDNGKFLGSVEALSSYDPVVKFSVSDETEFIAVYMKKDFLNIATQLQDASKHPMIGDRFVLVSSTHRQLTDQVLSADLIAKGEKAMHSQNVGNHFTTVFPIKDFSGQTIGVMAFVYDAGSLYATQHKIQSGIAALCLALLVAILTPLVFSVRSVVRPIKRTSIMLQDIAQGEGDLTKRLDIIKVDEIGELAGWFNLFLDKVNAVIVRIADNACEVESASVDFEEIAGQLSGGAGETSDRSDRVSTAAEEMSTNLNTVAAAMEESSTNISMVSTAAEEMTATINEIAQNAEKARTIVDAAVHKAGDASGQMNQLGDAATGIGKVVETITEISAQVNLLALNATIEAARAGEAGKGFAVVANEIKELAKQTSTASLEIRQKIEHIQGSTQGTVEGINEISAVINDVYEIVGTIATAVEEQSAVTVEIANNIAQASQGIHEVNENVNHTSSVAAEISRDITAVNQNAGEIAGTSEHVKTSAGDLKRMSAELSAIVSSFKIDRECRDREGTGDKSFSSNP